MKRNKKDKDIQEYFRNVMTAAVDIKVPVQTTYCAMSRDEFDAKILEPCKKYLSFKPSKDKILSGKLTLAVGYVAPRCYVEDPLAEFDTIAFGWKPKALPADSKQFNLNDVKGLYGKITGTTWLDSTPETFPLLLSIDRCNPSVLIYIGFVSGYKTKPIYYPENPILLTDAKYCDRSSTKQPLISYSRLLFAIENGTHGIIRIPAELYADMPDGTYCYINRGYHVVDIIKGGALQARYSSFYFVDLGSQATFEQFVNGNKLLEQEYSVNKLTYEVNFSNRLVNGMVCGYDSETEAKVEFCNGCASGNFIITKGKVVTSGTIINKSCVDLISIRVIFLLEAMLKRDGLIKTTK